MHHHATKPTNLIEPKRIELDLPEALCRRIEAQGLDVEEECRKIALALAGERTVTKVVMVA